MFIHHSAVHEDNETGAEPSPRKPPSPVAEPSPRDDEDDETAQTVGKKPGEKAEAISEKVQREAAAAIDIFGTELVS